MPGQCWVLILHSTPKYLCSAYFGLLLYRLENYLFPSSELDIRMSDCHTQ